MRYQGWPIINKILWHSPEANFTGNAQNLYAWYTLRKKITDLRLQQHLPGANEYIDLPRYSVSI